MQDLKLLITVSDKSKLHLLNGLMLASHVQWV